MEARIKFESGNFFAFGKKKIFPLGVEKIVVEILEPKCPYCGSYLKNTSCCCDNYHSAIKRFKANYKHSDKIVTYAYQIKLAYCFELNKNTTRYAPLTSEPENLSALFKYEKTFKSRGGKKAHISLGNLENGVLTFYTRIDGYDTTYKWEISGIEIPDGYPDVTVAEAHTRYESIYCPHYDGELLTPLGNCYPVIEYQVVEKIPYLDFIKSWHLF